MSHGLVNNVCRSHSTPDTNVCNQFIPQVVSHPIIRKKCVLQIMDGIKGVYQGGPGASKPEWTWENNALFVATDPVAMDHIGWDIIDTRRVSVGLPRVGEIGRRDFTPARQANMIASAVSPAGPLEELTRLAAAEFVRGAGDTEVFDRRTPEHVILAQMIGLGEFDLGRITYQRVDLS